LILGLAMAWRRRDEPALRLLLVWVLGGALLPAVAAGALPRRTTLMLPFAYALMALPAVAIGRALLRGGPLSHVLAAVLGFAFFASATASGTHLYFREWNQQIGRLGGGGELLDFVKILKTLPRDEAVWIQPHFPDLDAYLDAESTQIPVPFHRRLKGRPALAVLARSCMQPLPFTWMFRDETDQRSATSLLESNFVVETNVREGVRVLRVVAERGDLCGRHAAAGDRSSRDEASPRGPEPERSR